MFIIIVFSILVLQIILVTFTGNAFQVYSNYGLTPVQWVICLVIGAISWPVNLLLKIKTIQEPEPGEEEEIKVEKGEAEPTKDELATDSHLIKVNTNTNNR